MSSPVSPSQSPTRASVLRRIITAVVVLLALVGAVMIVNGLVQGFGDDQPEAATAGVVEKPVDVPQRLSDEQLESPIGVINNYLAVTPSYWNNFGGDGWGDPISTVSLDTDDVIITLNQPFSTSTTYQEQATEIRSWAVGELRQHKDNATVASVDLVAVRSSDGVMVGYEKL